MLLLFVCRINPTTRKHSFIWNKKVINIKQQPLSTKLTENCIQLRYRCNVFSRWKRACQQYTKNIQFSTFAVSNSVRMFGHFPSLWDHFPIFLVQTESYKRMLAFLFDALPVWQDNFARCLSLKYSIFSICSVIKLSIFDRI